MIRYILLTGFLFGLVTGFAQKKILKQAASYESAGLFEQAANEYKKALYQDATKVESIQGLKRNAQKVIDNKLSHYFQARNSDDLEGAISQFEEILLYQKELEYFNVSIIIPSYHLKDYENDKSELEKRQKKEESSKLDNKLNSLYESGIKMFESDRLKQAWLYFDSVRLIQSSYKETISYQNRIKERALTIAIVPDQISRLKIDESLRSQLVADISRLNNPLIKMVTRDNLDQLIEEQKLGLSGIIDEQTAVELGKLLGVQAMLITKVVSQNFIEVENQKYTKTAYTASSIKVYNQATQQTSLKTDYLPVSYQEINQKNRSSISMQYQLISVETAEILKADIVDSGLEDILNYAVYEGDYRALHPTDGTSIFTKGPERDSFLRLFEQKRNIKGKSEMEQEAYKMLSLEMARSIDNYFD